MLSTMIWVISTIPHDFCFMLLLSHHVILCRPFAFVIEVCLTDGTSSADDLL